MQAQWNLSLYSICQLAGLLYLACGVGAQAGLDIQRQQLPFGELVFQVPDLPVSFDWPAVANLNNQSSDDVAAAVGENVSQDGLRVTLPKIRAMIDRHTDDGSVISRHYSATLVESAWRNRVNDCSTAYLLESCRVDAGVLSLFTVAYASSVVLMAANKRGARQLV